MITNKDKAVKDIERLFESTSDLVLGQLDKLHKTLKSDDVSEISESRMTKMQHSETKIDENEIKLDSLIIQTIVLYNPVASDLRRLFAIYRIINNLERIGDLSIKIARLLNDILSSEYAHDSVPLLRSMLKQANTMVQDSLLSFINKDIDLAINTIKKDQEIDRLNEKLLKRAVKELNISNEVSGLLFITDIRSILSSIERIGDHAANISEAAVYALSGSNIKHTDLNH
jgi:phosphate transport system protein